ncbi:MAG: hypothetical protein R2728_06390 [Chitinophagales bacterium]
MIKVQPLFETKINPLKVYPNPIQSGNTLTISSPFVKGKHFTLEIINSIGELVYKKIK